MSSGNSSKGDGPGWLPFDLLGNPVPPNKGQPGRPQHVATAENLELAIQLYAERHTDGEVAAALGISEPTLRKGYFRDRRLKAARRNASMLVKGRAVAKLHHLAFVEGKLGAVEKVLKRIDKSDHAAISDRVIGRGKGEPKPAQLGKKELQKQVAGQVGGKFAPRSAPPRLIN